MSSTRAVDPVTSNLVAFLQLQRLYIWLFVTLVFQRRRVGARGSQDREYSFGLRLINKRMAFDEVRDGTKRRGICGAL